MRQFFIGGDSTWYGLINAVTAASGEMDAYERATDLERIGGDMLSMPFGSKKKPIGQDREKAVPINREIRDTGNLIKYRPLDKLMAK